MNLRSIFQTNSISLFHIIAVSLGLLVIGIRGLLLYRGTLQTSTWLDKTLGGILVAVVGSSLMYHIYRYITNGQHVTNLIHILFLFPLILYTGSLMFMQSQVHPVLYVLLVAFALASFSYHTAKLLENYTV